jgi:hypothetical protein
MNDPFLIHALYIFPADATINLWKYEIECWEAISQVGGPAD